MSDYKKPEPVAETFDIDKMPITNELINLHQEGNYLVGTTKLGIKFRQGIPAGKLLTKEGGKFKLIDRVVA